MSSIQATVLQKYISTGEWNSLGNDQKTIFLKEIIQKLNQQKNDLENTDSKNEGFKILTDISGEEDHFGDMDFKVAGSRNQITAIQLDNKISGLTAEVLKIAIKEANKSRNHIIDKMEEAISVPNSSLSDTAPKVKRLIVPLAKIGEVIGSGGKIINGLQSEFGVKIDLDNDSGICFVYGKNIKAVTECASRIAALAKEYKPLEKIKGKVFRIESFGAFVRILDETSLETNKEGMIHISNFGRRINTVAETVKIDDILECEVLEVNEKGQISLKVVVF